MDEEEAVLSRMKTLLNSKFQSLRVDEGWDAYLEGLGARRIGKLVGLCTEPKKGHIRVPDPMLTGGNQGFVEIREETATKIATLGLP